MIRQAIALAIPPVAMLLATGCASGSAPTAREIAAARPDVSLRTEYHPTVRTPLEHVGYSFTEAEEFMDRMEANGAEAVISGGLWIPIRDPNAPDGLGMTPPDPDKRLGQVFEADIPFDGVAARLPTYETDNSGCAWELSEWTETGAGRSIATGVFTNVPDNAWMEATFPAQPPGSYVFEIHSANGSWIGWWLTPTDVDPAGFAIVNGKQSGAGDFQFRVRTAGDWVERAMVEDSIAVELGPVEVDRVARRNMRAGMMVGNWNNPGFTYYPEWFFEEFPQAAVLDADGNRPMGGSMFDRELPTPNISTREIVEGTARYITALARNLANHPAVLYWITGGEALYATYSYRGRWTDYSDNEIAHFRAWLGQVRYDSIAELNQSWGSSFISFADVEPPRAPSRWPAWADWLDFRFDAMGERMGWHWQAIREATWTHPVLSCNHGTLFHGDAFASMGADFPRFGWNTDGFETGQIIRDTDPDLYNMLYVDSILGLGKPYVPARLAYVDPDPAARGGGKSFTPDAVWRYGLETLGAGAWHLGYIEYEGTLPDGEWQIMDTPGEQATIDFFAFAKRTRPHLANMHPMMPTVGVWLPHAEWAVDGFGEEWMELHRQLLRRQVPKHFVYDAQLRGRLANHYNTIVAASADLYDPQALAGLLAYERAGGTVLWMGSTPSGAPGMDTATIVDALAAGHAAVRLDSLNNVTQPITVTRTPRGASVPVDLAVVREAGQTFVADYDGLHRIGIRMPTYTRRFEAGFTYVLRHDDPRGSIIQQGSIDGPINDNAWVSIGIAADIPAGSVVYLGVSVASTTVPERIGWWASDEDYYPNGTAWIDGEPVASDHDIELAYRATRPAAETTLASVLTDGLSAAVVLVNIADDSAELSVDLAPLLARLPISSAVTVRDLMDPGAIATPYTGPMDVTLRSNNGAVLLVEPQIEAALALELESQARAQYEHWGRLGALTDYHRYAWSEAERFARDGQGAKAAAMHAAIVDSLGIRVDGVEPGAIVSNDHRITITLYDGDGNAIAADRAWVEVTPSQGTVFDLMPGDKGYELALDDPAMPPRYDYAARQYDALWGPARLRVAATKGTAEASRFVDIVIER